MYFSFALPFLRVTLYKENDVLYRDSLALMEAASRVLIVEE